MKRLRRADPAGDASRFRILHNVIPGLFQTAAQLRRSP